ncbi:hypothetical protein SuNHUV7_09330 (plasmid) [Pseudoseohaeicola sp. NH-UV-7]|uniref:hypothetical protein n=1 Tax=Sulfitobacter sp. TBRI5 TaxID=2989732 RepID=UPI003A7468DD
MKKLSRTLQAVLVSGFPIWTVALAFAEGPNEGSGDLTRHPYFAESVEPKGKMKMKQSAFLLEGKH